MGGTQLRHVKLWCAGKRRNWELGAHAVGEVQRSRSARRLIQAAVAKQCFDIDHFSKWLETINGASNDRVRELCTVSAMKVSPRAYRHIWKDRIKPCERDPRSWLFAC